MILDYFLERSGILRSPSVDKIDFLRHIPLGRIGLPEEIAEAVCYFSSDASAYTTGQILTVSGGFGLATPVYGDLANKKNRR